MGIIDLCYFRYIYFGTLELFRLVNLIFSYYLKTAITGKMGIIDPCYIFIISHRISDLLNDLDHTRLESKYEKISNFFFQFFFSNFENFEKKNVLQPQDSDLRLIRSRNRLKTQFFGP